MINSQEYQAPNSDNSKGMRNINNAIVDSGYRFGTQVYRFSLRQKVSVTPDVVDLATNSNGLSVYVAGATVSVSFSTDTPTTIAAFVTALNSNANISTAKLVGSSMIEIYIIENKEVVVNLPSVTGSTVEVIPFVELVSDLRIVPALVTIPSEPEFLRKDEGSTAGTDYIGYAQLGTSNASPLWRIKKVVTSGTVTEVTYADGNKLFDNVWNDRASLSYS